MKFEGQRIINASREEVWNALNSTEVLKAAIPGCSEFSGSAEEGFVATVTQKIGPVKATFNSTLTLDEVDAPNSYLIIGEGKGGAAGFAKGTARVRLNDHQEGTELDYEVDAKIGGKLAQLGSRLIGGVARKLTDRFFTTFQEEVEDRQS
ncbi:MAG: carbon monoxide dehydrogenase subunit G [Rhodobacteraceae bacterium]|nr:carbon monoxide dehydrogenase subunit G [Paracoccaceae bacterium]